MSNGAELDSMDKVSSYLYSYIMYFLNQVCAGHISGYGDYVPKKCVCMCVCVCVCVHVCVCIVCVCVCSPECI